MPYADPDKVRESKRLAARTLRGRRRQWKACLKKRYGLTLEQYDELIRRSEGRCAICERIMHKPCVDHDHATGRVRGLLCFTCNRGLHLLDNGLLVKAQQYCNYELAPVL